MASWAVIFWSCCLVFVFSASGACLHCTSAPPSPSPMPWCPRIDPIGCDLMSMSKSAKPEPMSSAQSELESKWRGSGRATAHAHDALESLRAFSNRQRYQYQYDIPTECDFVTESELCSRGCRPCGDGTECSGFRRGSCRRHRATTSPRDVHGRNSSGMPRILVCAKPQINLLQFDLTRPPAQPPLQCKGQPMHRILPLPSNCTPPTIRIHLLRPLCDATSPSRQGGRAV